MKIIFNSEEEKTELTTRLCPKDIGLNNSNYCESGVLDGCVRCWENVVEMEVKKPDYKKEAKDMICSGRVVESKFYDILVEELAKKLKEDDKKKKE